MMVQYYLVVQQYCGAYTSGDEEMAVSSRSYHSADYRTSDEVQKPDDFTRK